MSFLGTVLAISFVLPTKADAQVTRTRADQSAIQPFDQAVLDDLAPTGSLRAAMNLAQPAQAFKDPVTGELGGLAYDLGRELAARLGVPLAPVELVGPPPIFAAFARGDIDVAVFALDPALSEQFDFTGPYLELDDTYLLPAGSTLFTVEDVDQPGIRIAAGVSVPPLQYAELVTVTGAGTNERLVQMLDSGEVDAVASSRPQLIEFREQLPGSRILDGRFGVRHHAMALPKGRPAGAAYLASFVEEAKESGFVQASIERNRTRGVQVAPPSP
jgi:polar amino acid transport system substrate-binding protein